MAASAELFRLEQPGPVRPMTDRQAKGAPNFSAPPFFSYPRLVMQESGPIRGRSAIPKREKLFEKDRFLAAFAIYFISLVCRRYRMERWSNFSTFTFLFVSLIVLKILRSGNARINLAFRSTFRISDCVSDTPARQNASLLAFALAYSNSGLRRRYFVSA